MTSYVLEIKLLSPLTSAAGEGRIGLVDRDIAFDDLGLPILPGRRLKGLWRDAYRDITDAWQQCGEPYPSVKQIFGDSGQRYGDGDAYFHIANAELENASSLKEWLEYLQHHKIRKVHADDVVQHYAAVRAQTAIDRRTGSARENTLRLTRTLNSGLVFWAPVRFTDTPNKALENALALGATALQYMGTARTRGTGKIRCRFLKLKNGNISDLTPSLNRHSLPSIGSACVTHSVQDTTKSVIDFTGSINDTPTHILRYRLKLTTAAVIPIADGDPNTVVTRQDIPGSHLWGAAAWHYLNQANHKPTDEAFRHAFLDGGLRFLTAYPEADDNQQRMIPIPHSIRKSKKDDQLYDFVKWKPKDLPTKRLDRGYTKFGDAGIETQPVKTERNYHHARAANDRRIGRAIGAEVTDGGTLFTHEAIQAGQTFQGTVLGSENDLKNLKTLLYGVKTVSVGRSRSAQYGEAAFQWIDDPKQLAGLTEWNGFDTPPTRMSPDDTDNALIITTLSPLLAVNDKGHPDACLPQQELAHVLGVETSALTLSSSYTRIEITSGYNTHLRLPRQQWQAIGAGSVFVFQSDQKLTDEKLSQLERNGLGLRKGEGYGRIAVNRQNYLNGQITEKQLDDPDKASPPEAPKQKINAELEKLLKGIIRARCQAEMQKNAITVAKRIKNIPSNSLLGRLRQFLQRDPATAIEQLGKLRKPAMESLKNCQINTRRLQNLSGLPNNLYGLFEKTWQQPEDMTKQIIEDETKLLLKNGDADETRQTLIEQLKTEDSVKMCKIFLNHLLTALYRR